MEARIHQTLLSASLLALFAGCATIKPNTAKAKKQPKKTEPAAVQVVAATPEVEPAAIDAVRNFLERTRDYQSETVHQSTEPTTEAAPPIAPPTVLDVSPASTGEPESRITAAIPSLPELADPGPPALPTAEPAPAPPDPPKPTAPRIVQVSLREPSSREKPAAIVAPEPAEEESVTPNQPVEIASSQALNERDQMLDELSRRANTANDPAAEWQIRMARRILEQDDEADGGPSKLTPEARRILEQAVAASEAAKQLAVNPITADSDAIKQVDELRNLLAERADPVVAAIALCRKVTTFGVFDPMPSEDLVAGRSIQSIVYCELRNLRSEQTSDGLHRTLLSTRLELFTADGRSVWKDEEPKIEDRCRAKRTDFFVAHRVTFPPTLAAGDYILKVYVEDRLAKRGGENTHSFTIRSPSTASKK